MNDTSTFDSLAAEWRLHPVRL